MKKECTREIKPSSFRENTKNIFNEKVNIGSRNLLWKKFKLIVLYHL